MTLNNDEKTAFLERVQELVEIDVITKEVRDEIYKILLAACANALRQ